MKTLILALLLLGVSTARASTPVVGEAVIYRYDSTHFYAAVITVVNGDGSCGLAVFSTGASFSFGPGSQATYVGVTQQVFEGVTDNRWFPNPDVGLTGPTGATGSAGAAGAMGATGPGALVTATSTATLSLNGAAQQFDSAHDTEYTASVKVANTLSLTGGSAGHVDLVCDSSATPTAIVQTVSAESTGALTVGLSLATSTTLVLRYRVPAGHRCKLTSTNDTGTPTITMVRQVLQTLG